MYGTFQKEIMMSERTALRVALVGAGAAGQAHAFGYRNVSMAAGLESVQIDPAVVVDPNIELARRTADRYGYTDATADLQRVLDDPSIDAISVALPNSVHAEVLPAILRSDKHGLTEKPLGRNAAEAAELVALAGQSSAVTGVGFSFRRLPRSGRGARPPGRQCDWRGTQFHRVVQRGLRGLGRRTVQLAIREGDRRRRCVDR